MKIPKVLKIAGKNVKIVHDEKYCKIEKCYGRCAYDENKIYLDKIGNPYSKEKIEETLIHEVLHFCNAILRADKDMDDDDYVGPLAELLYQVIKQLKL